MLPLTTVVFLCLCTGVGACNQTFFKTELHFCRSSFSNSMETTGFREGCVWPHVKGTYHLLKRCVDDWASWTWCKGVGSTVDDFFLEVHQTYFSECGRVRDPPLVALILMVAPLVMATLLLPLLCVHLTPSTTS